MLSYIEKEKLHPSKGNDKIHTFSTVEPQDVTVSLSQETSFSCEVDQILLNVKEMHRNDIKSTEIKSDVSLCMCEST